MTRNLSNSLSRRTTITTIAIHSKFDSKSCSLTSLSNRINHTFEPLVEFILIPIYKFGIKLLSRALRGPVDYDVTSLILWCNGKASQFNSACFSE